MLQGSVECTVTGQDNPQTSTTWETQLCTCLTYGKSEWKYTIAGISWGNQRVVSSSTFAFTARTSLHNRGTFISCSPLSDAFTPATLDISCNQHHYNLSGSKLWILEVKEKQNRIPCSTGKALNSTFLTEKWLTYSCQMATGCSKNNVIGKKKKRKNSYLQYPHR